MKRSKFNLSHTQLHTGIMGQFIPVGLVEVLPGDTFQHAAQALIRAAPLATPPMHPVRIDVRHFFVPHRLVWDEWEDFITGGPDGMFDSVFPTMIKTVSRGSTLDHLGVRPDNDAEVEISALPARAVNLIWNEYYRDQDLQSEYTVSTDSGLDETTTTADMMYVNWEKDYFTTSRPFEQKGPDVTLPLGTSATGSVIVDTIRNETLNSEYTPMDGIYGQGTGPTNTGVAPGRWPANSPQGEWLQEHDYTLLGSANIDLSTATAATVNDLRLALALQRYQEARARFGSRYTEYLRYLGVRSSDARLQRPEYLGGGRSNLQFSEVLSTDLGGVESNIRPGQFGGHGIGANRTNRYRKFFEEHGYVISVMSVTPQTMYPDGLFRTWNRRTKEDFFQKELQHIGQQAVLNKEVQLNHNNPDGIFGYQDRYDEYRRTESQVHGEFRSGGYLFDWHFARNLPKNVALNTLFTTANVSKSPFQAQSPEDVTLYMAVRHQLVARRLLASRGSSFIL